MNSLYYLVSFWSDLYRTSWLGAAPAAGWLLLHASGEQQFGMRLKLLNEFQFICVLALALAVLMWLITIYLFRIQTQRSPFLGTRRRARRRMLAHMYKWRFAGECVCMYYDGEGEGVIVVPTRCADVNRTVLMRGGSGGGAARKELVNWMRWTFRRARACVGEWKARRREMCARNTRRWMESTIRI